MSRHRFAVIGVVCVLMCAGVASAATSSSRVSYTDRYGVLSDRNIFLKDRAHPTTRSSAGSASTQPTRALDAEQIVVLRGVVFEENAFRAYVENMNTGSITRMNVGDSVGRGKIGQIDLNGMWYEGPARTWVEIGCDLTGQEAAPPPADDSMVSATQPSSTQPVLPSGVAGLNPNDPTLTMEQKLKLRRMQELKGKQ